MKNYKSIRDEVTFDMQAAAISEHEDRIIKDQESVRKDAKFDKQYLEGKYGLDRD